MHRYEASVLSVLKKKHSISLEELVSASDLGRDEVLWAIENLSKSAYLDVKKAPIHTIALSREGQSYASEMLPEEQLLKELKTRTLKAGDLSKEQQLGLQWCLKRGFATVSAGIIKITQQGKAQPLPTGEGALLKSLSKDPDSYSKLSKVQLSELDTLSKRSLITIKEKSQIEGIIITPKGLNAEASTDEELIDSVTREVIVGRGWKSKGFKKYDVNLEVETQPIAARHPLRRTIGEVKTAFTNMGFTEVSGPVVEPSFWVFDSLFVPQDHPAREMQDTFYLSNPESIEIEGDDYVKAIRKAHAKSWKSEWNHETAEKAVLRTQVTSVSAHYISDFVKKMTESEESPPLPIKLFSVGRVFRNENIDYKHLADFYMTDGIIIGKDLTLANLFDTLTTFYASFGIKVKFKPAYFPFVEPGAEIYAYYEKAGEWVEMGGSGIIRSEVTSIARKKLTVLAWGLGIERMLLIKDKSIESINELYNNGIGWLRSRKM